MPRKHSYLDNKKKKTDRLDSAFDKDATEYPEQKKSKPKPKPKTKKQKTSRINSFLNKLYNK